MRSLIETLLRWFYLAEAAINVLLCRLFGDGPETQKRLIVNARRRAVRDARFCIRSLLRSLRILERMLNFDPLPWYRYDSIPAPGQPGHIVIRSLDRLSKWSFILLVPAAAGIAWLDSTMNLGKFFALGFLFTGIGLVIGPLMLCDILKLTKGWRSTAGW